MHVSTSKYGRNYCCENSTNSTFYEFFIHFIQLFFSIRSSKAFVPYCLFGALNAVARSFTFHWFVTWGILTQSQQNLNIDLLKPNFFLSFYTYHKQMKGKRIPREIILFSLKVGWQQPVVKLNPFYFMPTHAVTSLQSALPCCYLCVYVFTKPTPFHAFPFFIELFSLLHYDDRNCQVTWGNAGYLCFDRDNYKLVPKMSVLCQACCP